MLKKTLLVVALVLLVAVVGFCFAVSMQPDTFTVERSATIVAAPADVFVQVNDFKAWDAWSPWRDLDPDATMTISTPSAGKGATFSWNGNDEVGEGTLTILESKPDELIEIEQEFIRPFAGTARMAFTFKPVQSGTKVTWMMDGDNNFLGKAMCLFVDMDAMLGKDFERGLANVQEAVAKNAAAPDATSNVPPATDRRPASRADSFVGSRAGDEREVAGIKLCWCPAGQFMMGSPPDEPERRPGEDQVEVTLSEGFWMAKYETTQGQWKRVMGKLPGELTAELPEGDDFPVGNVNFAETEAFSQKLTELGHQSGVLPKDWEFRLPTEAQWEYACRAGTTTATSFGEGLSSIQANFKGEQPYNGAEPGPSLNRAAKVGSYPANAWGLHDMHGNIYEWCRDWYHRRLPGGTDPDLYSAKTSATKSEHGDISRVRRGGCWADPGWPCRTAFRLRFEPERRYDHIGFRVAAVQP